MKRLFLLGATLAITQASPPVRAADESLSFKHELQLLKDEVRALRDQNQSLQDQIDRLRANASVAPAPVGRETGIRGSTEKSTQDAVVAPTAQVSLPNNPPAGIASRSPTGPKVVESATHRFSLSSADGQYTIGLTGRLQLDLGSYLSYSAKHPTLGPINASTTHLSDGFNARRARIGVAGKAAGDFTYTFIYDAGGSQDMAPSGIEYAQIGYTGIKNTILEVGYSDSFFALEEIQSSNDTMFLERASAVNVATSLNADDYRANAGFRTWGDDYWIGAYVTGPSSSDSHTTTRERFGAIQRVTYNPVQENNTSVHIGVGVSELISAPDTGPGTARTITFSDRPELRIDPTRFLNTGPLGTVANPVIGGVVYNLETAILWDGFFYQGEYFHYTVDRRGLTQASFDGGYGELSYTFGGHRNYIPAVGAYSGINPDKPFSLKTGGVGAFELAARISYINLIDQYNPGIVAAQPNAINGGKQTGVTLGLNWYLNSNMRWMLNWVHVNFRKTDPSPSGGIPIGSALDAIALRWQVAY